MIVYKSGNILDDDADWLVNPVNTVGVMGAGLAKQFKDKYPEYFKHYKNGCDAGNLLVGCVYNYHGSWFANNERAIFSFPTKKDWRKPSKIEWIECGLNQLFYSLDDIQNDEYNGEVINSIAFPRLGCGLGGLDWETQVKPLMEEFASKVPDIEVRVYI